MTVLLVDNSNTRTKFILADSDGLMGEKKILLTADITADSVRTLLGDWAYDAALISSVVPSCREPLQAGIGSPCHLLAWDSPHGISLAHYPDYLHLGADRLANVLAMKKSHRFPAIAVDLGTAVTYDILDKDSQGQLYFAGGVIAAGLSSLRTCLAEKTALLPVVNGEQPSQWIGKNTQQALQSGALLGFVGMVRETLITLNSELGADAHIVLTGGDAALIADKIPQAQIIDEDLTLKGLLELSKCLEVSFFAPSYEFGVASR